MKVGVDNPGASTGVGREGRKTRKGPLNLPLPGRGGDDADQVAFRVFEPCPLAPVRRVGNSVVCPRLLGVVVFELDATTPHLRDNGTARR